MSVSRSVSLLLAVVCPHTAFAFLERDCSQCQHNYLKQPPLGELVCANVM